MAKKSALQKIYDLVNAIKQDDPDAIREEGSPEVKFSKAGARRMRVSLSETMKLCKQSRVELLKAMKKK